MLPSAQTTAPEDGLRITSVLGACRGSSGRHDLRHRLHATAAWGPVLRLQAGTRVAGVWWSLPVHRKPRVPLAVCAVFKDEAEHLPEWVTFHRLMGVEEFYLYDNGSTDDWERALGPELTSRIVRVTPWPADARVAQLSAYSHCLRRRRHRARWIAFLDIDEFLFSTSGEPLP